MHFGQNAGQQKDAALTIEAVIRVSLLSVCLNFWPKR